jgi:hypothetical protein
MIFCLAKVVSMASTGGMKIGSKLHLSEASPGIEEASAGRGGYAFPPLSPS